MFIPVVTNSCSPPTPIPVDMIVLTLGIVVITIVYAFIRAYFEVRQEEKGKKK